MEVTCGKDGNRQKPEEAKLTVSKLSGHVNSSVMRVLPSFALKNGCLQLPIPEILDHDHLVGNNISVAR